MTDNCMLLGTYKCPSVVCGVYSVRTTLSGALSTPSRFEPVLVDHEEVEARLSGGVLESKKNFGSTQVSKPGVS